MPFTKFFIVARKYFRADYRDIEKSRASLVKAARIVPNFYRGFQISKVDLGLFDAEWIIPKSSKNRVVLYLHGGGYMIGSNETHRPMVSRIAYLSESKALLINYRLAPEHPYPAALEDAVSAYEYLLKEGYTPEDIIVAGDSAGGGLAIALLLYLKDHNKDLPKSSVLLCPWTDLTLSGESIDLNARFDPILNKDELDFMRKSYAVSENYSDPYISPLFGDLSNLPPIYIQAGGIDPILDDSTRLFEKLQKVNVDVKLDVYPGKFHVWQAYYNFISDGRKALIAIAEYIKNLN